tara:strand:- start:474 stop:1337 length:864 start_codon:yes stop_codon:yes gene_type:complete
MLDKIVPLKITYFLDLIRFSKPIGFMLLLWPCWFALTFIPHNNLNIIKWYFLFFIGAFLMRSAGCIINDLVDIKIDKKVTRTANRPLTSKKISVLEALIFLFVLLFLSLIVILQFNFLTIIVALISFPFVILYPFMKRYTYWPQLILGIVFSWGIIIVNFQFINSSTYNYIILYIGCIFWTLAYDTIYAYQDFEDDKKNNIKSTAILFNTRGIWFVKLFYLIFFSIIGYLSWETNHNFYSLIVIIMFIFVMNKILNKWKPTIKNSSNYYFKLNNAIGLCCFLFLLIF